MRASRVRLALATAALLLLAACTSQKEPAENAMARVESSLAEVRTDALQYSAEELLNVETSVARLKGNLEKEDYRAVILAAPAVSSEIKALAETVSTKKAEAEATMAAAQSEWTELTASVPPMVEKLQARVDTLAKTRRYPKGMDKSQFEAAKSGFEEVKTQWTEAGAEYASGQAADAVRKARSVKARGEELMQQLEVSG